MSSIGCRDGYGWPTELIIQSSGHRWIYVFPQGEHIAIANVGDSRAVLATTCDDGNLVPVQLTVDFKPNLPRMSLSLHPLKFLLIVCIVFLLTLVVVTRGGCEDTRMQREGVLLRWRARSSPGLAPRRRVARPCNVQSLRWLLRERFRAHIRARSDAEEHHPQRPVHHSCDRRGTLAQNFPEILSSFSCWNLPKDSSFLLQVWDVMTNREAVEIVSSTPDRGKSAKRLVECAMRAWRRERRGIAMDDISAICLFFHSSSPSHP